MFVSPLGIEGDSWASAVAIQPNGKIVVGGFTYASGLAFALIRLNANGNLDPSFGSGGALLTDMLTGMGGDSQVAALAIQPSGKIVAAGYASIRGFYSDFALARYTDNGTLDPTFGTGGKVLTDLGGTAGIASLVAQRNGRIVAGGTAGGDFAVARYTDKGSLDQTFGAGGTVLTTSVATTHSLRSSSSQTERSSPPAQATPTARWTSHSPAISAAERGAIAQRGPLARTRVLEEARHAPGRSGAATAHGRYSGPACVLSGGASKARSRYLANWRDRRFKWAKGEV